MLNLVTFVQCCYGSNNHACNEVKVKLFGFVVLAFSVMTFSTKVAAKPAQCVIKTRGDIDFSGCCDFQMIDDNGSFLLHKPNGKILPEILDIKVYVIAPGRAEVRGLTVRGINSRWGPAKRSVEDAACWVGSDFTICAY